MPRLRALPTLTPDTEPLPRGPEVSSLGAAAKRRVLVGLGGSPFASALLTAAHDLAISAGGTWIAVHVETPYLLAPDSQRQLDADLTRARELGAEIVVTRDLEITAALLRVARDHQVTDILIGQSRPSAVARWHRRTFAEQLVRQSRHVSVHVLPAEAKRDLPEPWRLTQEPRSTWSEYVLVLATVLTVTVAGLFLPPVSHLTAGLIYLLAVIALSIVVGRWPVLLAGVLSGIVWEYIFLPPRFAFAIESTEDWLLFGTYFAVALVAGQLTARVRTQARNEHLREERATALLQLTRILAEAPSFDAAVAGALRKLESLFGATTVLSLCPPQNGRLIAHAASGYAPEGADLAAAVWACEQGQPAGRFTPTHADVEGYYVPLQPGGGTGGVLGVRIPKGETLSLGQRDLIEAFARHLALHSEREQLRAASEREKLLAASEKLHRSLFDSVSHELRTPLAVIDAAIDGLDAPSATQREKFVDEVRIAARRLNRLVGNLLDQSRLESGALRPRLDWCSVSDLVNAALDGTRDALSDHPLDVDISDLLPPVRADFALTEHALMNLILNACSHTPPGTAVTVSAGLEGDRTYISVADRGPGFPASLRDRLFRKFSRGESAGTGGLGLGLSIVRGLVTAQGGEVSISDRPEGGAVVTLLLPHAETPADPCHE